MSALTTQTPAVTTATRNACKLCAPLGACWAMQGIRNAITILHGSQGCATYIRRYMISHFKEPLDVASSSFSESTAIFGGAENLQRALENVIRQYRPSVVGIATTCLAETIGEDVGRALQDFIDGHPGEELPAMVCVATPSYRGTHAEGYQDTVRAIVEQLVEPAPRHAAVNLLPGMVSPADIRYLRELADDFGLELIVLPDYSQTLDGPAWDEYHPLPPGGTPLEDVRRMAGSRATIEFHAIGDPQSTAGAVLEARFGVPRHRLPLPVGVERTDALVEVLQRIAGRPVPEKHALERGRLIDAIVDAHKYVFDKKAVVYGEQELVAGIAALLCEVGMVPTLCASGATTGRLGSLLAAQSPDLAGQIAAAEGKDFTEIGELAAARRPDLLVGNSKGYALSRQLNVPLVRVGFPIHDRVGGARTLHLGYRGAQQLFDRLANELIATDQSGSPVGYSYM